jgi:uncharacterized protein
MPADSSEVFSPARPDERLVHLDVIRGCALFGVLAMNVQYHFRGPYTKYVLDPHPWPDGVNVFVDDLLKLLVEAKAMTLLGMLFAIGLAIQMERKEARGDGGFWGFAWRRMGALIALGLLHVVLIWEGDILITYALAGILLFPFLRRKTRTIHLWIAALAGLTVAMIVFFTLRRALGASAAPDPGRARAMKDVGEWAVRATAVLGHGSWWEALVFRLQEWSGHALSQFAAVYQTFFSSLLGLAVWRTGVLRAPEAHLPALRRWAAWLLGVGLVCGVVDLYFQPIRAFCRSLGPWGAALSIPAAVCAEFGYLLLAMGYAALLLLAWQGTRGKRLLGPFAFAGRMALTCYLTQSLAMTALFHGWGLGLYGSVTPWQGLVVSILFFALQVVLCRWWLGRFLYGPAEWLWRCASYARRQPFIIPQKP